MAVLLLSAAGAKPLDGAEVTGLVSTVFDPALKSQIIRVGSVGKRASAHNTSISVRCTSRLRFVVFQMCASGSDGTSIELHVRVSSPSLPVATVLLHTSAPPWWAMMM